MSPKEDLSFNNMLTSVKRIIRLGWTSFSRDGGAITTTVFILVLTISLVTCIFFLKGISQILISNLEEKVDISVYFKEDTTEQEILSVKQKLYQVSDEENIEYISKEQALEIFVERHREDLVLMASLEEIAINPFLASLNIKASDPVKYKEIANFLEGAVFEDSIEKIDYNQRRPVIERIFNLTNSFKKIGIGISVLLVLLSFLVVLNTTRLAIYNLKQEVEVQKLVGASNWFIRGPFLVQGVIAGAIAALISFVIFGLGSFIFSSNINALFSDLNIWQYFTDNIFTIILIQLVTGIGLGVSSSIIAIRKYLKV